MKIVAFVYGFPHRKSVEGLNWLTAHGFRPSLVLAAPKIDLGRPQALIPIGDQEYAVDPIEEAGKLGLACIRIPHNEADDVLPQDCFDLGVVLGARILKPQIITRFRSGVLNIHPGLLPMNRGLCTIERAVLNSWPQGCAAHLIDRRVDRGRMIKQRVVPVFRGDTWHSMRVRVERYGRDLMIKALNILLSGQRDFDPVAEGSLGSDFNEGTQKQALDLLDAYTKAWGVDEDY